MEKNFRFSLILLLLLLFFITVCFLRNEYVDLDFSKKINHEKFSSYFTSIGALITAFSLILIYLQFNETKKQNDFSIQPKLFLEARRYDIMEQGESSLAKSYITIKEQEGMSKDNWGIKVLNIGNGTALKVEVEWIFDMNEVKNITEKHYSSRIENIMKLKFSKDYIKTNEITFIGLLYVYLNLFGSRLHSQPELNKENIIFEKQPLLEVKLKFFDIQNVLYTSVFEVTTVSDTTFVSFSFNQK